MIKDVCEAAAWSNEWTDYGIAPSTPTSADRSWRLNPWNHSPSKPCRPRRRPTASCCPSLRQQQRIPQQSQNQPTADVAAQRAPSWYWRRTAGRHRLWPCPVPKRKSSSRRCRRFERARIQSLDQIARPNKMSPWRYLRAGATRCLIPECGTSHCVSDDRSSPSHYWTGSRSIA